MEIRPNQPQQPTYKQEFKESVDIYDKSFQGAMESNFDPQKRQYYKAMKESLEAMQDSANGLVNQHLLDLKQKLSQDTNAYIQDPSAENQKKIQKDIKDIRNSSP
ncbi:MAG: hypothetical protein EB053_05350 [Chlamydiae bacterium]|nr:hypothetical protein [Chlamydiota bacterium]